MSVKFDFKWKWIANLEFCQIKFIYSEKATIFFQISTVDLSYLHSQSNLRWIFVKFCCLLRIYELYYQSKFQITNCILIVQPFRIWLIFLCPNTPYMFLQAFWRSEYWFSNRRRFTNGKLRCWKKTCNKEYFNNLSQKEISYIVDPASTDIRNWLRDPSWVKIAPVSHISPFWNGSDGMEETLTKQWRDHYAD